MSAAQIDTLNSTILALQSTVAAQATFMEFFVPKVGISTTWSTSFKTSPSTPVTSLPSTSATPGLRDYASAAGIARDESQGGTRHSVSETKVPRQQSVSETKWLAADARRGRAVD